jgi:hypothetical protein
MNTVAIGLDEKTAHELAQLAHARAVEPSALAEEAIRTYLRSEARRAIEQEAEAFRGLPPSCWRPFRANTRRFMGGAWSTTTRINWPCSGASRRDSQVCRS